MLNITPSPPDAAAAAAIAIITILIYHKKRIHVIIKSYSARRELRQKLAAQKAVDGIDDDNQPRISGIFIHPVKSLRPVSLSETTFDKQGLLADRRMMIVRPNPTPIYGSFVDGEATHRFFTQRQSPSLATVEATEPVTITNESGVSKTLIKLSSALIPNEHVYINVHPSAVKTLPVRYRAGLWSDTVEVADVGDEAAAYVAKVVGKDDPSFGDARVVSLVDSSMRKVNELYCPLAARIGLWGSLPQGGLTDGFPVSCTLHFRWHWLLCN